MIYLVENNLQLKKIENESKSDIFIAFTPDIYVDLKKRLVNVYSSGEFFFSDDHFIVSKLSNEYSKAICQFIQTNSFFKTKSSYKTFEFYIKLHLSHIIMLLVIYNRLKEKFKNEEFKSIPLTNEPVSFSTQPILNEGDIFFETVISNKLKKCKHKYQYSFLNSFITILNKLKIATIKDKPYVLTSFQNGNMKKYLNLLKKEKGFNNLWIRVSSKHNFLETVYSLYALIKNRPVLTVPSFVDINKLNGLVKKIDSLTDVKFGNKVLIKLLNKKVYQLIGHCMYLDNTLSITEEYIKKFNDVRILSITSLGFYSIIAEAVKNININSTLISHGSHVLRNDNAKIEQEYLAIGQIDPSCYKEIIVQSPYAYSFIKDKAFNIKKSKPIMWGNSFENRKSELLQKMTSKITILHASTPKTLFRPIIFETPFEYINNIIEIAKKIKDLPDIKYIVRFRSTDNISLETMTYMLRNFNNIELATEKTFQFYLDKSDIFISYSSTTIEETMLQNKDIILFGNDGIYNHLADVKFVEDILLIDNKKVCFAKNNKELLNIIMYLKENRKKDKYQTYYNEKLYLIE